MSDDLALTIGLIFGTILATALIGGLTWWMVGAQLDLALDRAGLLATLDLVDGGPGMEGRPGGAQPGRDARPG